MKLTQSILAKKFFTKELTKDCELFFDVFTKVVQPETNAELFKQFDYKIDPFQTASQDLAAFNSDIIQNLQTDTPELDEVTQYYFRHPGKHFRPTILLLLSRALAKGGPVHHAQSVFAQVLEMIHCSSLVHDDVIDQGVTRRGIPAIHSVVGKKRAVMGGDYLIATASYMCSQLQNMELMNFISHIMENLTKGELIQADTDSATVEEAIVSYVHKTYFKTASLIAYGCRGIGLYGGHPDECFEFGKHLGLAFQYVDDILDFVSDKATLGKPNLNDMKEGLATGPVLFALHEQPELLPVIQRKFSEEGDLEQGEAAAHQFGINRTRLLVLTHLTQAMQSLHFLPASDPLYQAIASLAAKVYSRVY